MRIFAVFTAGALLFGGLGLSIWLFRASLYGPWAMLVGCGATVAAVWGVSRWYDRWQQRKDARHVLQSEERYQQLVELARLPDFELKVMGSSQFLYGVGTLAMGVAMLAIGGDDLALKVGGGLLFLIMGLAFTLAKLPQVGRPLIAVSKTGIKTAYAPFISWRLIHGVTLRTSKRDQRGDIHATLEIYVPTLAQESARGSWFYKLTAWFRRRNDDSKLTVEMLNPCESPSVVGRLIEWLWRQNTGRKNDWEPYLSGETNAAMQQFKQANAALEEKMKSSNVDPADVEKEMAQMLASSEIIRKQFLASARAWDRRARTEKWVLWTIIASIVIYIVAKLMRWID